METQHDYHVPRMIPTQRMSIGEMMKQTQTAISKTDKAQNRHEVVHQALSFCCPPLIPFETALPLSASNKADSGGER